MNHGAERSLCLCRTTTCKLKVGFQLVLCKRRLGWYQNRTLSPSVVRYHDNQPLAAKAVCCFAHYDPQSRVDETVLVYLRGIVAMGYTVVFVSTSPYLSQETIDTLAQYCTRIVVRQNVGLDFASWKCALHLFPELYNASSLLLTNDSAYLLGDLGEVFTTMNSVSCDFWGMTESCERRRHLQSYFLVFRERTLQNSIFAKFWNTVEELSSKKLIIRRYETALTYTLAQAGLQGAAYAPAHWFPDGGKRNPSLLHGLWAMKELGVPLLKRQLLTENPYDIDVTPWLASANPSTDHIAAKNHLRQRIQRTMPLTTQTCTTPQHLEVVNRATVHLLNPPGRLDVLLPTYNGQNFLSQFLDSLMAQRAVFFTLIIRDDGSTDSTMDILSNFSQQHDAVTLLRGERFGINGNVFTLLRHSTSPYFAFADQDDYWYPHKVSTCLKAMSLLEQQYGKHTPLLVYSDAQVVDKHGYVIAPSFKKLLGLTPHKPVPFAQALVYGCAQGCTILGNAALRQKMLLLATPDSVFMYDWWTYLTAVIHGATFCIEQPLLDYRQHPANTLGAISKYKNMHSKFFDMRESIQKTQQQAAALLSLYGSAMTPSMHSACKAWSTMGTKNFCTRKYLQLRFGFTKPGARKVPFFFLS